MSATIVAVLGVLGWFVGAAVWVLSRNRASERYPLAAPACANPACGEPLPAAGWLPLFGFGTARRCATCGASQPVRRLLFEGAVGAYYALAAARTPVGERLDLAAVLVFAVPLLIVLLIDWWTRFIHTDVIGVGLLAGLGFAAVDGIGALLGAVAAALGAVAIIACFFGLATVFYRSVKAVPIGLGDVYLAAMIGAMVRLPGVIPALFLGILLAGVGSVLLLATRRAGRRDAIPYGPYLCVGALLALLR